MRKNVFKILLVTAIMVAISSVGVYAAPDLDGTCIYNGSKLVTDFDSDVVAKAITNLQPGDKVTFSFAYENKSGEDTDWYMASEIIQTLEETNAAAKVPEGGGYTFELVQTDKNRNKVTIFSNSEVGGEAKPANLVGLKQATNALEDWFYLETLGAGDKGRIDLMIAFEGETEVNDYMDTEGSVGIAFAVQPASAGGSSGAGMNLVKTGDDSNLFLYIGLMIAGILLLLIALLMRRKEAKKNENL